MQKKVSRLWENLIIWFDVSTFLTIDIAHAFDKLLYYFYRIMFQWKQLIFLAMSDS